MLTSPYLRLMRLHQPAGIWLLFFPCAWAVVLASHKVFEWRILALFAIGAVLMRSAGCIINDIADRKFDAKVERTKTRPLASGELKVSQAVMLLFVLLFLSLIIAISLGKIVVLWAVLSLFPVVIYPLMKRVSWWPQLFLGLVFNWGALMGWAAVRGEIELPAILLYLGGIFWTLGYDTIYAIQDKTKVFVAIFYVAAISCFSLASGGFFLLIPAAIHAVWQVYFLDINSQISARKMFLSNIWFGALVLLGML